MKPPQATLALLGLMATAACYSYQTIPVDAVRPDLPVRLRVKPEATEHVAQVVGYLTQDVDGTVISLDRDTVLLTVRSPMPTQGSTAQQIYQRLDLPVSQLIEVKQRELNRTKTYVCVGVAAAGVGALAVWAFTSASILGTQSTPPPTNNGVTAAPPRSHPAVLVPLGRLRLGP